MVRGTESRPHFKNVDQCGGKHYTKDVTGNEIRDSDLRRVASAVTSLPAPQMADSPFLKALGTPTIRTVPAQTMVRAFLGNCGEVTHCMPVASEPVEVGCFGDDKPVSRVLDKLVVAVIVAVGDGQGGNCPCGLGSVTIVPFGWCFLVVGQHGSKASPTSRCLSANL